MFARRGVQYSNFAPRASNLDSKSSAKPGIKGYSMNSCVISWVLIRRVLSWQEWQEEGDRTDGLCCKVDR